MLEGGRLLILFMGAPGVSYLVGTSENLSDWAPISFITADEEGFFIFEESPGSYPSSRFYSARIADE